jgi:hypothetical protein
MSGENGERVTESGIALPDLEGHPIAILDTDVPGLMFNVAVPEGEEAGVFVRQLAERVALRQRDLEAGDLEAFEVFDFASAHSGEGFYLTPVGARHITSVGHGRAMKVDPLAGRNQRRIELARGPMPPSPFPRRPR